MNRHSLESELNKAGVKVLGWEFTLKCDNCGQRWEPFVGPDNESPAGVRPAYWRCPRGCNHAAQVDPQVEAATPRRVVVNNMTGVVCDEADFEDFRDFVISVSDTETLRPPRPKSSPPA